MPNLAFFTLYVGKAACKVYLMSYEVYIDKYMIYISYKNTELQCNREINTIFCYIQKRIFYILDTCIFLKQMK